MQSNCPISPSSRKLNPIDGICSKWLNFHIRTEFRRGESSLRCRRSVVLDK